MSASNTALASRPGEVWMTIPEMLEVATHLAKSGYFRDAGDVSKAVAKILYGREIGVGPMAAMMGIHIIEGKPAPSAGLIAALVQRSGRYRYEVEMSTDTVCSLTWFRDGEEIGSSEFDMDDAKRAGVAGKAVWKNYPSDMLFARALTQGARRFCPDVFLGAVYVPEELWEGEPRAERAADAAPAAEAPPVDPSSVIPPFDAEAEIEAIQTVADGRAVMTLIDKNLPAPEKYAAWGDCLSAMIETIGSADDLAAARMTYERVKGRLASEFQAWIEDGLATATDMFAEPEKAAGEQSFDPATVLIKPAHWNAAGMLAIPPDAIARAGGPSRVTLGTLIELGFSRELARLAGLPDGVDDMFARQAGAALAALEAGVAVDGQPQLDREAQEG